MSRIEAIFPIVAGRRKEFVSAFRAETTGQKRRATRMDDLITGSFWASSRAARQVPGQGGDGLAEGAAFGQSFLPAGEAIDARSEIDDPWIALGASGEQQNRFSVGGEPDHVLRLPVARVRSASAGWPGWAVPVVDTIAGNAALPVDASGHGGVRIGTSTGFVTSAIDVSIGDTASLDPATLDETGPPDASPGAEDTSVNGLFYPPEDRPVSLTPSPPPPDPEPSGTAGGSVEFPVTIPVVQSAARAPTLVQRNNPQSVDKIFYQIAGPDDPEVPSASPTPHGPMSDPDRGPPSDIAPLAISFPGPLTAQGKAASGPMHSPHDPLKLPAQDIAQVGSATTPLSGWPLVQSRHSAAPTVDKAGARAEPALAPDSLHQKAALPDPGMTRPPREGSPAVPAIAPAPILFDLPAGDPVGDAIGTLAVASPKIGPEGPVIPVRGADVQKVLATRIAPPVIPEQLVVSATAPLDQIDRLSGPKPSPMRAAPAAEAPLQDLRPNRAGSGIAPALARRADGPVTAPTRSSEGGRAAAAPLQLSDAPHAPPASAFDPALSEDARALFANGHPGIAPAAPSLSSPALVPHLAQQVVQSLTDPSRRDPNTPVDLALDPPELGRVRMSLTEVSGTITLTIHAERPETADLMRRHLDLLAQEFARGGLDAPSVRISQDDSGGQPRPPPQPATIPTIQEGMADSPAPDRGTTRAAAGALDLRL